VHEFASQGASVLIIRDMLERRRQSCRRIWFYISQTLAPQPPA
jgi:hypothetical protein